MKTIVKNALAMGLMLLVSCQKPALTSGGAMYSAAKPALQWTGTKICTEMPSPVNLSNRTNTNGESRTNGVLFTSKKWPTGGTVRVLFQNGTTFLQNKVKQFAVQWSIYGNINFQFVGRYEGADVRVNFDNSGGSWSYVGTDCLLVGQTVASMNFGWFDQNTSDDEFSRTVVHEFGHVLGLVHEHQNPTANIPWDKPKVYDFYAKQGWSTSLVDLNIFQKYSTTQTNYTQFDPLSIMEYPVDKSLTTNGYSIGWNTALSATDKTFIGQQYPFPSLCVNNYEPNNTMATATYINTSAGNAGIGTKGDQDFYSMTTTSSEPKLKVTLSNLPADYDLKLYNAVGGLIATSQNTGTAPETVIYNGYGAALYYFQVYPKASDSYNSSNCYTVQARRSAANF